METVKKKKYKASIMKTSPSELKGKNLSFNKIMLGLSIGSDKSEGEKLKACVKKICLDSNFPAVLIADGVYHLTLQILYDYSEEKSIEKAKDSGKEHYLRNEDIYNEFQALYGLEVHFLSKSRESKFFFEFYLKMEEFYNGNILFKACVDDYAKDYISKIFGDVDILDYEKKINLAKKYFLEECALVGVLMKDGWDCYYYAGPLNAFYNITMGMFENTPSFLIGMKFISIRLSQKGWVDEKTKATAVI